MLKFRAKLILLFSITLLTACGGGSDSGDTNSTDIPPEQNPPINADSKAPSVLVINSIQIQENTTDVLNVIAEDPEDDILTYSLDASAADSELFNIDQTGALKFNNAPDFENALDANGDNTYETRVNVSDGYNDVSFDLTIEVIDTGTNAVINTPPILLSRPYFEAEENQTAVGQLHLSDKEENTLHYNKNSGKDQFYFSSLSQSGYISFFSAPNFEDPNDSDKDNEYVINITVSDGELSLNFDAKVVVTDANDPPQIISPDRVVVNEKDLFVQQIEIADEDKNDVFQYDLAGGADLFEISDTGVLSFIENATFDDVNYANEYTAYVSVNDGSESDIQKLTVHVTTDIARLDLSFGDVDPENPEQRLGSVSHYNSTNTNSGELAFDAAVTSNNKLVVVGYNGDDTSGGVSSIKPRDMVIWRYTEQGVLDTDLITGFGPIDPNDSSKRSGFVTHHNAAGGDGGDMAYAVAIDNNDRIVVVGESSNPVIYRHDSVVWRYTADGQLDTSFGAIDINNTDQRLGYVPHNIAPNGDGYEELHDVVIAADNSIFVTGQSLAEGNTTDMLLMKYTPQGELDTAFGRVDPTNPLKRLGYVTHHNAAGGGTTDFGTALTITANGKIVVVGGSYSQNGPEMTVWRYTVQGSLDLIYQIRPPYDDTPRFYAATAVTTTVDNKIIVTGSISQDMAVFRLTEQGFLDTDLVSGFGPQQGDGRLGYNFFSVAGSASSSDVAILPDNRIIVLGASYDATVGQIYTNLWRFTENGLLEGFLLHNIANDGYSRGWSTALVISNNNELIAVGNNSKGISGEPYDYKTYVKRFVSVN